MFRYGGEEFLVVFKGRSAKDAVPFVESVRETIAGARFVLRGADRPERKPRNVTRGQQPEKAKKFVTITISIGLAERSQRHSTPDLVLDAADAALYRAKDAGRNCLKLAEGIQGPHVPGVPGVPGVPEVTGVTGVPEVPNAR